MSDKQEIKKGSLALSKKSHAILSNLVYDESNPSENKPFTSIVEGFRFAFALGYNNNQLNHNAKKTETISPRQFVVEDYYHLLLSEISTSGKSLGGLISEYAEGGCDLIDSNENILFVSSKVDNI